jgi:hypothetical protein
VKIFSGTFSITGTGAVTVPAGSVLDASVAVVNAATTVPTDTAAISSISGSTINVVVIQHAASANSIESAAKSVSVIALVQ